MVRKSVKWFVCLTLLFTISLVSSASVFAGTYVNVLSPNGGETYKAGAKTNIAWKSEPKGDIIHIFYSVDSGTFWAEITPIAGIADNGSYEWTLPNIETTKARVKVERTGIMYAGVPFPVSFTGKETDVSNGDFAIEKTTLIQPLVPNVPLKPIIPVTPTDPLPILPIDPILPLVPATPAAPNDLTGNDITQTTVTLKWSDNAINETGFTIERKVEGSAYNLIATTAADAISQIDSGLSPDKIYTYRIKAKGTLIDSAYSNELTIKTDSPAAPDGTTTPPSANTTEIRLYIDSKEFYVDNSIKTMDTAPVIREGRTLLPIRYVAEALGADVAWDPADRKTTVTFNGKTLELWIEKNNARVNGSNVVIDPDNQSVVPLILPPGRTMLPVRFVVENLGCEVNWQPSIQEVRITHKK